MTKRLIAASLAAAFSFGTAFGLTISNTISQNRAAALAKPVTADPGKAKQHDKKSSENGLVCLEDSDGVSRCYPKEIAPGQGSDTTCIERNGKTLCYSTSQQNKPGLDL